MPVVIAFAVAALVVTAVLAIVAHRTGLVEPTAAPPDVDGLVEQMHRHPALRRFVAERRDTSKATGWLLTVALGTIAGLTLAFGLVLEMVQTREGFAKWDDSAARWGADSIAGPAESALRFVTTLGSTPFVISVCVVVSIVEYRRGAARSVVAFMATVVLSQLVLSNLIKVAVGRQRPDIGRLVTASGFSFPSGHTAASAAVYAAAALVLGRRLGHHSRALLAGLAAVITIAVAASRVLLGAHWLTDVIAGAALGWACFALCSIAYGGRLLQFGEPVEQAVDIIATESPSAVASSIPTRAPTPTSRSRP